MVQSQDFIVRKLWGLQTANIGFPSIESFSDYITPWVDMLKSVFIRFLQTLCEIWLVSAPSLLTHGVM